MQTQGSLHDTSLATLLQTMQQERSTGTLSLQHDSEVIDLHFLFGHLFHASGPSGEGEDVVVRALGLDEGSFRFDPRAKLPAEETIKASPSDLIAEADRRREAAPRQPEPARATLPEPSWAPPPQPELAPQPEEARPAPAPFPEPAYQAPAEESRWDPSQAGVPSGWPSPPAPEAPAEREMEFAAGTEEAAAEREAPPAYAPSPFFEPAAPAGPAGYDVGASAWAPAGEPLGAEPAEAAVPQPPEPAAYPSGYDVEAGPPAAEPAAVAPLPEEPSLEVLYPLPAGRAQYQGLKAAFVDFPRLLRTLEADRHTGYIRLYGDSFTGTLLLHEGDLLEALFSSPDGSARGEPALADCRRVTEAGSGLLDVIDLSSETALALAELFTARPLFTGLLGRFVNFQALLEYLAEERIDGSVVVSGPQEMGIIILRGGRLLGAYTEAARDLSSTTDRVATLAREPRARIEVRSGGSPLRIDLAEAMARS